MTTPEIIARVILAVMAACFFCAILGAARLAIKSMSRARKSPQPARPIRPPAPDDDDIATLAELFLEFLQLCGKTARSLAGAIWDWLTYTTQCAWCKRLTRVPFILIKSKPLNHGICKPCAARHFTGDLPEVGRVAPRAPSPAVGRMIAHRITQKLQSL